MKKVRGQPALRIVYDELFQIAEVRGLVTKDLAKIKPLRFYQWFSRRRNRTRW
jgi:hypothetical protein